MKASYIIRNGRVMDPRTGLDRIQDLVICNNRIVDPQGEAVSCDHIIDATGCIVSPGLIDFHTHVFYEGSAIAIRPDFMIPQGTTSAVDAGTSGTANFESFYKTVVVPSTVRLKSFLTVYSGGQLDPKLCEDFNPALFNLERMERIVDKYRDNILGLKIRFSRGVVPDDKGMDYLKATVELADLLNARLGTALRVCVHTTNSPVSAGDLASCLRPGDIFCHCFQGSGNNLVLENGEIDSGVLQARKRGVLFDAANGKGNFGIETAKRALAKNFLPDIISSDLTNDKFNMPPYDKNLPTVLSKYLTLGLDLMTVLRTVTEVPAEIMGMAGQIGTLQPGAYADVVVLKEKNIPVLHKDWKNDTLQGNVLLVPQMTLCAGEIQFCQTDFWL
ncbi:amidohydrolase family protein [Caproiciproducens faecalis]|uniref:Amidohydrolase family protein n=1 Tax=Caproiciproducens faecalis TaxID=2820301 RepID=A0ABS7DLC2_9FIRM|nr:amidohydrolase family protein [Caproiciproducens faecalis]MBW7571911.1 amidohydrolase family protein [Caproiciproducens faecalis]